MSFKPNDKVVYVVTAPRHPDAHPENYDIVGFIPVKGPVYCVATVINDGIGLVGSTCVWTATGQEVGWNKQCFRKVEEIREENRLKNSLYQSV